MEKCIADGQDYLKSTKKTITKTKTMVKTLADAKRFMAPPKRVARPKKTPKKVSRKIRRAPIARRALAGRPRSPPPTLLNVRGPWTTKATVFKTSSRSNLPLPGFGFIDVCFCLDVTSSMCGELAQVQSTIANLIEKISSKVST